MTRTRRLALVATGVALTAAASAGIGAAQADTGTAPITTLRSGYVACAGVDGVTGVCVEDPFTTISELPRVRQVVYDLTGVG